MSFLPDDDPPVTTHVVCNKLNRPLQKVIIIETTTATASTTSTATRTGIRTRTRTNTSPRT